MAVLGAACCFSAEPAGGQEAPPPAPARPSLTTPANSLTLDAAVKEALRQRPLLVGDSERVGAARARVTQARAGLLPRIDLQGSATDGPLGAPPLGLGGLVGTPIKKHTGGSLNLVQTLLDFGRARNLVQARRTEMTASEETLRADTNRVALEVQQAYLQALQALRLRGVNQQILEQRRLVARQAVTLQQNGLASRVDVDLAEFNVSQAELALTRSENGIDTAFAALGAAVGRPVPSSTRLTDLVFDHDLASLLSPAPEAGAPGLARGPGSGDDSPTPAAREHPPRAPGVGDAPSADSGPGLPHSPAQPGLTAAPPPGLEDAIATALRERPELGQAAAQVRAAHYQEAAARAGNRPLITGVGSVGKINPVPLFESSDKPYTVGIALTIPVFTGGLVQGQVEEARRNAAAARTNVDELTNQIRQQATSAVSNLIASQASLQVARAELVRARDALSLATQRYQARLGSIVELTQAQVNDAVAENDFIQAVYDQELARAALEYATGYGYPGAAPRAGPAPAPTAPGRAGGARGAGGPAPGAKRAGTREAGGGAGR